MTDQVRFRHLGWMHNGEYRFETLSCNTCGAVVIDKSIERHIAWHQQCER